MSEVLDAVKSLQTSIEIKAVATAKEIADQKTEFERKAAEANQKIADLTEELKTKGATIQQILDEQKELRAKGGRLNANGQGQSLRSQIAEEIGKKAEEIKSSESGSMMKPIEIKAAGNISSANLTGTGNNYISYLGWEDGMEPLGQNRFRSLVRTIQSSTDFVRYPRANTPVGEGSFARVNEGSAKPQIDRDYTMIDLTLKPMAGFSIVSRQSLRNIVFLQSWLPTSLLEQLQDQEDVDFTNTLYAAATPNTFTGDRISQVTKQIAALRVKKYQPNAINVAMDVWTQLVLHKETGAGYNLPNIVTVDAIGTVRFLGLPVIQSNALVGNQVIIGDFRKAAIVQSEGLVMRQSDSHASIFTTNELAFLLERTEGLAIFRPDAFFASNIAES